MLRGEEAPRAPLLAGVTVAGMDDNTEVRDRVDRFLAAFNEIEGELRQRLGAERHVGYKDLAHRFRDANKWWQPNFEKMETIADIRNFLVHKKVHPTIYAAVPSTEVLELIERIRDQLIRPVTVWERFARSVVEFGPGDSLGQALHVIAELSITHFPVRDAGEFRGLLTTNGIAHWLAHVGRNVGLADLDTQIADVLAVQEEEDSVRFVARGMPVDEAFDLFSTIPQLQAVLVTHSGKASEAPLGIVTAWDVAAAQP
jgi:CBS domain-containing protein